MKKSIRKAKADMEHPNAVKTTKLSLLIFDAIIPKNVAVKTYIVVLMPQNISHGIRSILRHINLKFQVMKHFILQYS